MIVSIQQARDAAATTLNTISDSPTLDAEILITHITGLSKTHQYAYPEAPLSDAQASALEAAVTRRSQGEPIAYIVGHQSFWMFDLLVTPAVLVPRPETECMIEWLLKQWDQNTCLKVADLGVGSGAIALALAQERPQWTIDATDHSPQAIALAEQNAKRLEIDNVRFHQGDWCVALPERDYDIIVSNPPYIAEGDAHLYALQYEPMTALASGPLGLDDITVIIDQATAYLKPTGMIAFEHGYDQGDACLSLLENNGYRHAEDHLDLSQQSRFSTAKAPSDRHLT